jgi:hypothetical protein
MSKKYPNTPKGKATTAEGTMPASMLKAHGLKDNIPTPPDQLDKKELNSWAHRRAMKRLIQATSLYRLQYHGVMRPHLARPLVLAMRYFCDPQKAPSRNRDAAVENDEASVASAFTQPAQIG